MWLTDLLKKVLGTTSPEEQLAMTPLEYLKHINEKLKGDLETTYHRESMDLTITVIREDIYTLVALMDDCSTNIRQRAALPKEAFLNPSSTEKRTMKLKTFLIDYQGRSMGRLLGISLSHALHHEASSVTSIPSEGSGRRRLSVYD